MRCSGWAATRWSALLLRGGGAGGGLDDARVVLTQVPLPCGIRRVRLAWRVGVGLDRVIRQWADRAAVRGIQVRVLDPAVAVEQERPCPSSRRRPSRGVEPPRDLVPRHPADVLIVAAVEQWTH